MKYVYTLAVILALAFAVPTASQTVSLKAVSRCTANQYATYRLALQICDGRNWRNVPTGGKPVPHEKVLGKSCLDIMEKGLSHGDGEYLLDPLGQGKHKAFVAYCDMTSFGGGWTMCYATDSHVKIKTELTTTPKLGYRADCNNIPFKSVLFVDEKTKEKATFTKGGAPVTFSGNYNKKADVYGLWTPKGVASTKFQYQLLICDDTFYKGLFVSGYFKSCYKECNSWCSDTSSPYFRTAAVSTKSYFGVAFNENGHKLLPNRLISAGIR